MGTKVNNYCENHPDLIEHLLEIHKSKPGFTENCASKCLNRFGQSSYEWLIDIVDETKHLQILDLACGSGLLLEICSRN